tara:strand:- start:2599 stop:3852 length:1254 start_codon:yes stop_codon:yes gene_type:complete
MPQVGKDKTTLELQRQRYLENLQQITKNRAYFKKARSHLKDTGSSLIQGKETKSTLESLLDAGKRDENLEKLAIKELGASPATVKPFLQSLDDTLKTFLLDRFQGFKKVFKDNFTIPSSQNLKSAFEIFNRQEIEKMKDIEIPTPQIMRDYLNNLSLEKLRFVGQIISKEFTQEDANRFENQFRTNPNKTDVVLALIARFVKRFPTEIDGYTSLFFIMRRIGLTDFPKPILSQTRTGVPASQINMPIPNVAPQPPPPPGAPAPPLAGDPMLQMLQQGQTVMGIERYKLLVSLSKADLIAIAREYSTFLDSLTNQQQNTMYPKITQITTKSKAQLLRSIILRGYNPRTQQFDIEQLRPGDDYVPESESLGDNQITQAIDHMEQYYDDFRSNPTLKAGVDPAISNIEGFGMHKIYKLRK